MNHDYIPIPNEPNQPTLDKCIECGYPESKHGDNAVCDCCDKTGNLQHFMLNGSQALLTRDCLEREKAILEAEINSPEGRRKMAEFQSPANQEQRLQNYKAVVDPYDKLIGEARKIDEQLHLSSDIFTAKTIPIEELRKAIWANAEIPQDKKFFEYVAECKRRITHLQSVIFDLDKQKIEAYSEQKAWHVAMNDYANKLRTEEREQLKINDINYDVKMPKPVTPRAIKVKTGSAEDKKRLRQAVAELNAELIGSGKDGISESVVAMIMVAKNWDLEKAIGMFRRNIKEGLSEQSNIPPKKNDEDDGLVGVRNK